MFIGIKTQLKYTIQGANARFSSPQATLFSLAYFSKKKICPSGTRILLTSTLVYFNCTMSNFPYVDMLCLPKYLPACPYDELLLWLFISRHSRRERFHSLEEKHFSTERKHEIRKCVWFPVFPGFSEQTFLDIIHSCVPFFSIKAETEKPQYMTLFSVFLHVCEIAWACFYFLKLQTENYVMHFTHQ